MRIAGYLISLITTQVIALAGPCDFQANGDARNGLVFKGQVQITGLSVPSALGQLQHLALEGGYQLGNELIIGSSGELSFIQATNQPPVVIRAKADSSGRISLSTKLARGQKVDPAAMEAEFCSMLAKLKPGKVGEEIAAAARSKSGLGKTIDAQAVKLSTAIGKEVKKAVAPAATKGNLSRLLIGSGPTATPSEFEELFAPIRAKYLGQNYRIDGQIARTSLHDSISSVNDMLTRKMEVTYDVRKTKGLLGVREEPGMQHLHFQIKCQLANDQRKFFQTLAEGDSVTLVGTVTEFDLNGMVLTEARRAD